MTGDLATLGLGPEEPCEGLVGQQEVVLEEISLQNVLVPGNKFYVVSKPFESK